MPELACSDARSWVDATGMLWMYGGHTTDTDTPNGGMLNDLWRFNASHDSVRHPDNATAWTYMGPLSNNAPPMNGTVNEPGTYYGEKLWPGGRVASAGWYDESNDDLLMYGGLGMGHDETTGWGYLDDLWRWNGSAWSWSGGEWTNSGEPPHNHWPGARAGHSIWSATEASGGKLALTATIVFGGENDNPFPSETQLIFLNDMWIINSLAPPTPPSPPPPMPSPTPAPTNPSDPGLSLGHSATLALVVTACVLAAAGLVGALVVLRRRRAHAATAKGLQRMVSRSVSRDELRSPLMSSPRMRRARGDLAGSHNRAQRSSSFSTSGRTKPGLHHAHNAPSQQHRVTSRDYDELETHEDHLGNLLGDYGAADLLIPYDDIVIQRKLAAGGGGNVYLGEMSGVQCVLKEVFSQVVDESWGPAEFWHEAKMLHMLKHPHVVQFLGVTQNDTGDLYLVTEFCAPGNLSEVVQRQDYDAPEMFRVHSLQLAKTMKWLHQKDVIHRDLKPQNVLIDQTGNFKLCDLGLARVQGAAEHGVGKASMTGGGGTPAYMAPEAMRAPENSRTSYDGQAADVYSCAMVFYFMWVQTKPYASLSAFQIITAVSKDKLRPELPRATPPLLAALITSMWSEDPTQRPNFVSIVLSLSGTDLLTPPTDAQLHATEAAAEGAAQLTVDVPEGGATAE
jgi:tRNA A-37 threonylcarbamoyl transferase component Bud32